MKIRHRLSLQFTLITGIILSVFFALIYILSARYIRNSFYKLLQDRALITAQVYLEKDEVTRKKFLAIEKSYQQSLPGEVSNIYDQYNRPVFIEKIKYTWPPALLDRIRKQDLYRFTFKDKYALGIFYPDNQGNFVVIVTAGNRSGAQQLEHLAWILGSSFLLGLLIIFIMGQWYARRALQPINNINRQVKNIRSTNLHLRVHRSRNKDEIDELAIHFNELLEHLENAFEMQRSFVSNASYEMRTPLTTIIDEIAITLHKDRNNEEYVQTLRTVLDESEKLKVITDGLLQLTRLEYTLHADIMEAVRLDEMLWELKEYWKSRIFAYVLDVQLLNIPEDTAKRSVKGNRQLLLVALQNMIKNAFKFSHNQPVSVRLSYSPDGMTMAISDKGIGIIPEDLERIFMPLYRADNAHNFPGYGIGLSMSHKILQLHGASIHVFSEAGRGATFSISFNRMR